MYRHAVTKQTYKCSRQTWRLGLTTSVMEPVMEMKFMGTNENIT